MMGLFKEASGAECLILSCTLKKETEPVYKSEMIDCAQNISQEKVTWYFSFRPW